MPSETVTLALDRACLQLYTSFAKVELSSSVQKGGHVIGLTRTGTDYSNAAFRPLSELER